MSQENVEQELINMLKAMTKSIEIEETIEQREESNALNLYRQCIEIRNFEIQNLVNRNNFFMVFQGVLMAGVIQGNHDAPHGIIFLASACGLLTSLFQVGMSQGAKYWQEAWEYRLARAELRLKVAFENLKSSRGSAGSGTPPPTPSSVEAVGAIVPSIICADTPQPIPSSGDVVGAIVSSIIGAVVGVIVGASTIGANGAFLGGCLGAGISVVAVIAFTPRSPYSGKLEAYKAGAFQELFSRSNDDTFKDVKHSLWLSGGHTNIFVKRWSVSKIPIYSGLVFSSFWLLVLLYTIQSKICFALPSWIVGLTKCIA